MFKSSPEDKFHRILTKHSFEIWIYFVKNHSDYISALNSRIRTFEEVFQASRAKSEELSSQVSQIESVILQELSSNGKSESNKNILQQLGHNRKVIIFIILLIFYFQLNKKYVKIEGSDFR